jgi:hypothetical protein
MNAWRDPETPPTGNFAKTSDRDSKLKQISRKSSSRAVSNLMKKATPSGTNIDIHNVVATIPIAI